MGCCKSRYKSIERIKEAIQKNTIEFKKYNKLEEFRDRAKSLELRHGICLNLIMNKGQIYCPLHPTRNHGKDLRIGFYSGCGF